MEQNTEILDNLLQSTQYLRLGRRFTFQKDNDHKDTAKTLQEWLWVQVWALAGPLKDIQRLVPKPLLHSLVRVLRVIVLLKVNLTQVRGIECSGAGF